MLFALRVTTFEVTAINSVQREGFEKGEKGFYRSVPFNCREEIYYWLKGLKPELIEAIVKSKVHNEKRRQIIELLYNRYFPSLDYKIENEEVVLYFKSENINAISISLACGIIKGVRCIYTHVIDKIMKLIENGEKNIEQYIMAIIPVFNSRSRALMEWMVENKIDPSELTEIPSGAFYFPNGVNTASYRRIKFGKKLYKPIITYNMKQDIISNFQKEAILRFEGGEK